MGSSTAAPAVILLANLAVSFAAIYVTDSGRTKVVEISGHGQPCKMHSDRGIIDNMIRRIDPRYMQRIPSHDLDALAHRCRDVDDMRKQGGFIFPGTKWCGPGNTAANFNDLGYYVEEDKCCREHDHCSNTLEPGQCRQGVCNTTPFTMSHCDCDTTFKRCLASIHSEVANTIGLIYFNIAGVTCFKDRRACPEWMRADSSYTWYCEEWKFTPSDKYEPSAVGTAANNTQANEIADEGRARSKIDSDLVRLYGKEPAIERIMDGQRVRRRRSQ